jgi:hypothetical protein
MRLGGVDGALRRRQLTDGGGVDELRRRERRGTAAQRCYKADDGSSAQRGTVNSYGGTSRRGPARGTSNVAAATWKLGDGRPVRSGGSRAQTPARQMASRRGLELGLRGKVRQWSWSFVWRCYSESGRRRSCDTVAVEWQQRRCAGGSSSDGGDWRMAAPCRHRRGGRQRLGHAEAVQRVAVSGGMDAACKKMVGVGTREGIRW